MRRILIITGFLVFMVGIIGLAVDNKPPSRESVRPDTKGTVVYMDGKAYSDPNETMRYTVNCVIVESTDCFIENAEYVTLDACLNVEVRDCRNLFVSGCKNMRIQGLSDQTIVCEAM